MANFCYMKVERGPYLNENCTIFENFNFEWKNIAVVTHLAAEIAFWLDLVSVLSEKREAKNVNF